MILLQRNRRLGPADASRPRRQENSQRPLSAMVAIRWVTWWRCLLRTLCGRWQISEAGPVGSTERTRTPVDTFSLVIYTPHMVNSNSMTTMPFLLTSSSRRRTCGLAAFLGFMSQKALWIGARFWKEKRVEKKWMIFLFFWVFENVNTMMKASSFYGVIGIIK